jgi:predicted ABC-type ATPase
MGGHPVPEDVVRRRYHAGLRNLLDLYKPMADTWRIFDNSHGGGPRLVAKGSGENTTLLMDEALWKSIQEEYGDGTQD